MKLLLLDPNPKTAKVYQDVFESWGFSVFTCGRMTRLKTIFNENSVFKVIITDLDLPGVPRGKLISELKKYFPLSVIIVLTDRHSVSAAVNAIKDGADDFVLRPFETGRLETIIFTHLKQRSVINSQDENRYLQPDQGVFNSRNQLFNNIENINRNLLIWQSLHRESSEYISDALLMIDKNERVILINNKMLEVLGIVDKELIGKEIFEKCPELKETSIYSLSRKCDGKDKTAVYKDVEFIRPLDKHMFIFDLRVITMTNESLDPPSLGRIFIGAKIREKVNKKINA